MSVVVYLIVLFFVGLVVGALARLALPGKDPLSIWQTAAVGIAGSFLAGIFWWLVSGRNVGGILVPFTFSVIIMYFIRRSRGGSLTDPGRPPA